MRIGINAQLVTFRSTYRQAGVSRFTEQLIRALQGRDISNQYCVFLSDTAERGAFQDSPNFDFRRTHLPTTRPIVRILWEQLWLPHLARMAQLDLLHCPVNVLPLLAKCPMVLTIHDLTFLVFPDRFKRERRGYLSRLTRLSAHRAACIMADSENTKGDIVRLLDVPAEKIEVVYPGVDERFRPPSGTQLAAFRDKHGLPNCFILYVGTLEPRKNVDRLIRAYAMLIGSGLRSCPLVIAGARGWMVDRVFAELDRSGLREHVFLPGYVALEELPLWYGAATLFVYPSLYEGFGLPPLEAMACGTPTIVSNVSSLPEVAGTAALSIDPTRSDDLAEAMAEVLQSQDKREQMIEAGLRQAATFSWERAAHKAMDVYQRALT